MRLQRMLRLLARAQAMLSNGPSADRIRQNRRLHVESLETRCLLSASPWDSDFETEDSPKRGFASEPQAMDQSAEAYREARREQRNQRVQLDHLKDRHDLNDLNDLNQPERYDLRDVHGSHDRGDARDVRDDSEEHNERDVDFSRSLATNLPVVHHERVTVVVLWQNRPLFAFEVVSATLSDSFGDSNAAPKEFVDVVADSVDSQVTRIGAADSAQDSIDSTAPHSPTVVSTIVSAIVSANVSGSQVAAEAEGESPGAAVSDAAAFEAAAETLANLDSAGLAFGFDDTLESLAFSALQTGFADSFSEERVEDEGPSSEDGLEQWLAVDDPDEEGSTESELAAWLGSGDEGEEDERDESWHVRALSTTEDRTEASIRQLLGRLRGASRASRPSAERQPTSIVLLRAEVNSPSELSADANTANLFTDWEPTEGDGDLETDGDAGLHFESLPLGGADLGLLQSGAAAPSQALPLKVLGKSVPWVQPTVLTGDLSTTNAGPTDVVEGTSEPK